MSSHLKIHITDKLALERRVNELKRRDDSIKARLAPTLRHLWNTEKPLATGAESAVFDDLNKRFPNFSEVIEYWRLQACISRRLVTSFQSAPVLLGGDPGLGKTYFANEAAKALELHYAEINMATVTAGFVLSGGSVQWSEGTIGFIAKSIAESPIANPLLLLDEIDKARGGFKYEVLGPFYPLLEKHSASRFKDEALELQIDASHVNWIMTANVIENIPAPILSRVKLFHIALPTEEQMPHVIRSIYEGIRQSEAFGQFLDENLPEEVIQSFIGMAPRSIKRNLTEACSKAFLENRSKLRKQDLDISIPEKTAFKIGFI